ncbi:hypothetical protein OOK13_30270 [Streptomyces sp. NBC_00378]|uniref:hypothetical protein n=1 Tax=unclassified Streptomyces TaxID=2593676 RepID=UPI0022586A57|nr:MULTISPECIES: hypothetical protein [unclassified Streptomyces]MCX5112674.1 hypothetical protein [Streptomyces sp. NBC_00378]
MRVRGPGRVRVLALLEPHREATRTSWLAAPLDAFAVADFDLDGFVTGLLDTVYGTA